MESLAVAEAGHRHARTHNPVTSTEATDTGGTSSGRNPMNLHFNSMPPGRVTERPVRSFDNAPQLSLGRCLPIHTVAEFTAGTTPQAYPDVLSGFRLIPGAATHAVYFPVVNSQKLTDGSPLAVSDRSVAVSSVASSVAPIMPPVAPALGPEAFRIRMLPQMLYTSPIFVHLFSGALAGGVSRTLTAPLDRVKAVLQVNRSTHRVATTAEILRTIVKEEGVLGLFRGNGANCIKVVPECAIKFVAYDYFKRILISARHQSELAKTQGSAGLKVVLSEAIETESAVTLSMMEKMIAGGAAGAVAQLAVYPLEVVKSRLATQRHIGGIIECLVKIKRNEGFPGFYRGLVPSLLGIIPYAGIDLAVFETLKRAYNAGTPDMESPVAVLLVCGGVSSALGQMVSYPLALVRTRLQVDGADGRPRQFKNMSDVFRKTVHHEGFRALYRGLPPNLMKAVPAVSITWAVYEGCKLHLHRLAHPAPTTSSQHHNTS